MRKQQVFKISKFNVKKLNDNHDKQVYKIKILNRFVVLENPEDITESSGIDINNVLENVCDNVKISAKDSFGY